MHRHTHPAYVVLGMEPKLRARYASALPTELHPHPKTNSLVFLCFVLVFLSIMQLRLALTLLYN